MCVGVRVSVPVYICGSEFMTLSHLSVLECVCLCVCVGSSLYLWVLFYVSLFVLSICLKVCLCKEGKGRKEEKYVRNKVKEMSEEESREGKRRGEWMKI